MQGALQPQNVFAPFNSVGGFSGPGTLITSLSASNFGAGQQTLSNVWVGSFSGNAGSVSNVSATSLVGTLPASTYGTALVTNNGTVSQTIATPLKLTGNITNAAGGSLNIGAAVKTSAIAYVLGLDTLGNATTNNNITAAVNFSGPSTNASGGSIYPGAALGTTVAATMLGIDATGREVSNNVPNLALSYVRDFDVSTGPTTLGVGATYCTINGSSRGTLGAAYFSSPQMCPAGSVLTNLSILDYSGAANIGANTNTAVYLYTNNTAGGAALCTLLGGAFTQGGTNSGTTAFALAGGTNTISLVLSNVNTGVMGTNCYVIGFRILHP